MMYKIYLDMDDTIVDFRSVYQKLYDIDVSNIHNENIFMRYWYTFINDKHFENLPWNFEGKKLYQYLVDAVKNFPAKYSLYLLTSTGRRELNAKYNNAIINQKIEWLKRNNVNIQPIFVSTCSIQTDIEAKASYAGIDSILIDDSSRNIDAFEKNGGIGILFDNDADKCIDEFLKNVFLK